MKNFFKVITFITFISRVLTLVSAQLKDLHTELDDTNDRKPVTGGPDGNTR